MPVCRGVSRLPPFLGWFVCVCCPVAVVIVWFESRLSRYGSFALLSVVRGRRFVFFLCVFCCCFLGGGFDFCSPFFTAFLFIFRIASLRCFCSVGRLLLVSLGTVVVGYCCLCDPILL